MSGMEIERKFLVRDSSFKQQARSSSHIRQGYICSGHGRTVRVRLRDNEAFLTETFFPMTELNGAVVVNMPQLNEVLRSCDGEEDGDEFGDEDTQPNTIHTTATSASTTTTAKTVPLTATTTKPSDDDDDFAADDDD